MNGVFKCFAFRSHHNKEHAWFFILQRTSLFFMTGLSFLKNFYFPKQLLNFLGTPVFGNNLRFIDWWTIPHFLSGLVLMLVVKNAQQVFLFLILFEVFESVLVKQRLAAKEPLFSIAWDLLTGYIGILVATRFI